MKNNDMTPLIGLPSFRPEALAEAAAVAVREVLAEGTPPHTARSYATALRYWASWYQLRYGLAMRWPVPEPAVVQFVVDHLARRGPSGPIWELPGAIDKALVSAGFKQRPGPLALSTLTHRIAVLSKAHTLRGEANPCAGIAIRELLSRARRAAVRRGERPRKKRAITRPELEALLGTCDNSLEGLRDRALLCFAFASGGRRRSEVAAADVADLHRVNEHTYIYRLVHSKSQQAGASTTAEKPVVGRAALALAAWLKASGVQEGPVFRRLWKQRVGLGLSPAAVGAIVQRRARTAGLEGDFGGHSLRAGFVTEGARQGIALPALMAMTEHRSVASVAGYFHAGEAPSNPAAQLLEDPPPEGNFGHRHQ